MLSIESKEIIWFPQVYGSCAALIKQNSRDNEIIYSSNKLAGMILASISERATANALFPEINASSKFDPYLTSKVIIFTKADKEDAINKAVDNYKLLKVGENKIFLVYINHLCQTKIHPDKPLVSFGMIFIIFLLFLTLFFGPQLKNKSLT
jgi:hypothetical protein